MPSTALALTPGSLLAKLQQETDEAIAECRATTEREVQNLRADAVEQARQRRQALLMERRRQFDDAQRTTRATAEQRVLGDVLSARAGAIDRVIRVAAEMAGELARHPGLEGKLREDISRALSYLPDGRATVWCNRSIEHVARHAAAQVDDSRLFVEIDEDIPFGIIVQSGDGKIEVDSTITRRLACEQSRLAIQIAHRLQELAA